MTRRAWCVIAMLAAGTACAAPTTRENRAAIMNAINARVATINRTAGLAVDTNRNTLDWLGYRPEGGGTLIGYTHGDTLCKIVGEFYHAFGMVRIEMYYIDTAAVFIYEREDYYPRTDTGLDRKHLTYGHEARYYVAQRKLVESNHRGKDRFGPKRTARQALQKLLHMSDVWKQVLHH